MSSSYFSDWEKISDSIRAVLALVEPRESVDVAFFYFKLSEALDFAINKKNECGFNSGLK